MIAKESWDGTRRLGDGVATVDAKIGSGDVAGSVAQQESDGTHEVFGGPHLALGNQGCPLPVQLRVLFENLPGPIGGPVSAKSQRSGRATYSAVSM